MKRFLLLTPILFVLLSAGAFADSVRIFFLPNDGSGDNFGFIQKGVGTFTSVVGGAPFDFFSAFGYAPGTTLGGGTDLFISGGFAQFGGNSYELSPTSLGTLFLSTFTLPTNGKDFVKFPVEIAFSAPMMIIDTGEPFDVSGGARGTIIFSRGQDGLYYARAFAQAPEPGTLGLMGTGLIGILALVRKRLRI